MGLTDHNEQDENLSKKTVEKDYKYIDHLDEDDQIHGQKFVCMSFLSPEGIKNCTLRGIKIRGVYATYEEAQKRSEELSSIDKNFHVFVGEVGKWLPWDPDPDSQNADQVFREKELNDIMIGYKKNLQKAKELEKDRKTDLLSKAISDEKARRKLEREQNDKKAQDKQFKSKFIKSKLASLSSDTSSRYSNIPRNARKHNEIKKVKTETEKSKELADKERDRLKTLDKEIKEKGQELEEADSNINKVKKLYAQLKKKEESNQN